MFIRGTLYYSSDFPFFHSSNVKFVHTVSRQLVKMDWYHTESQAEFDEELSKPHATLFSRLSRQKLKINRSEFTEKAHRGKTIEKRNYCIAPNKFTAQRSIE